MSFPSYPEYKDSGVEWLGEVPKHWDVSPSRRIFRVRSEPALAADQMLTASQKYGVLPQSEYVALEGRKVVEVILGKENLKHVEPDDFIISMRSFQGGIEWCRLSGSTSFHYLMLTPVKWVYPPFFAHLFKSSRYIEALRTTTDLIRDGQELRFSNFAQVPLPVIPFAEQEIIASFLNAETSKIDAMIAEQEKLIELLKEKRDALVMSAMTSGKEERMCRVADIILRPVNQQEGELYTPLGLFNRGRGLFHKEPRLMSEMGDSDFYWIKHGDLIISGQFAWEGAVAMAGADEEGCVVSHRYPVLRGKAGITKTEYLFAFLSTKHGDFLLNENSRGAAGRNRPLNIESLLREMIAVPPMPIQDEIVNLVQKEKQIREEIRKQGELLNEHRSALISAAVTGKIDVRNLGTGA